MNELNSLEGFRDRFWYWRGKSGARYIHSIYAPDNCPPLPGAVFIMVQKLANGERAALEVGRFSEDWDYVEKLIRSQRIGQFDGIGSVDEIHVHLLAQNDDNAEDVVRDLVAGIGPRVAGKCSFNRRRGAAGKKYRGFHEDASPVLAEIMQGAFAKTTEKQSESGRSSGHRTARQLLAETPDLFDVQPCERVLASA